MSFESPEKQQYQIENKVFECPTGTFTVEYGELAEEEEQEIKDIFFRQEKDIDGKELEGEVSISLGEYLPEGWVFEEGVAFGADPEVQKIIFPEGGLELNKSLTVMFHEIGHANVLEKHREEGTYEEYIEPGNNPGCERDAWAYALRQIRSLMKKGIIAEEVWRDRKMLTDLMYSALSSGGGEFGRYTKGHDFDPVDLGDINSIQDVEFHRQLDAVAKMIEKNDREFKEKWGKRAT